MTAAIVDELTQARNLLRNLQDNLGEIALNLSEGARIAVQHGWRVTPGVSTSIAALKVMSQNIANHLKG
jgi:hypothetical protein